MRSPRKALLRIEIMDNSEKIEPKDVALAVDPVADGSAEYQEYLRLAHIFQGDALNRLTVRLCRSQLPRLAPCSPYSSARSTGMSFRNSSSSTS
jgi:hypothetical protein